MIKWKKITDNYKFSLLKNTDTFLWGIFACLVLVSIAAYFTAASQPIFKVMARGGNFLAPLNRHIAHLVLGVLVAFVVQFISIQHIQKLCRIGFWVSIALLILSFVPKFSNVENGSARWISLWGINFQPSEFAKLTLIVYASDLFARAQTYEERAHAFWKVLGMLALTCSFILTSNLSTCILLGTVILAMMILGNMPWKHILLTCAVGIGLAIAGFFCVKTALDSGYSLPKPIARAETWVNRVNNWHSAANDNTQIKEVNPEERIEVNDQNRQAMLAKVAIARGGKTWFGVGPGNSVERSYLPLAFEDYIFAIIVEETGAVGSLLLIIIYLLLFYHACAVTAKRGDIASRLTVMGLALMIILQALVHMSVSCGIIPVTGQPLPFISHGGTAIILMSAYIGIMLSVGRDQKALKMLEDKVRQESEHDSPIIEEDVDIPTKEHIEENN